MTHLPKILFLIPLYLMSCTTSQIEEEFSQKEEQTAIGFNAKVNSRALADIDDVQENGFAVWGGYENTNVFNGDKVTYSNGTWGYGTAKYWILNKEYTFFATYPHTASVTATNGTYKLDVETPAAADLDILTASAYTDTNVSNFNPEVALQFTHLMTRVNVQIGQDFKENPYVNYRFRVNKLTLSNVKSKGTYTITVSNNTTSHSWAYETTPMTFTYTGSDNGPGDFSAEGNNLMIFGNNGLILLPQPTGSIMVDLEYEYGIVDIENETIVWEPKTATMNLPSGTWEGNTSVNYIITLSENNVIKFTQVTVATWGANQSGGTIIIK